jgi:hypothetical protein
MRITTNEAKPILVARVIVKSINSFPSSISIVNCCLSSVYPSTVFSKLKSLNILALEEDRKTMAFDIKG